MFSGFGDDESGFYETYGRAFREVWDSERDWGEVSSDEKRWGQGDAPEMGRSTDGYETAEAFYSGWSGFVSSLSFGWVDEYNLNEVSRPSNSPGGQLVLGTSTGVCLSIADLFCCLRTSSWARVCLCLLA